jgi:predicted permease
MAFAGLETLWRDVRYATRRLVRDWRFSAGAVLILTLGIGANTAIFSVVNAMLFRSLPFAEPDRLVNVYQNAGEERLPTAASFPAYRDIAAHTDVFSGVTASTPPLDVQYLGTDGVHSALAEFSTSNYLSVLGLKPAAGRWFDAREERTGADPVAVIGYTAWVNRFGSKPEIIGGSLIVNGAPVTVIGIGPRNLQSTVGAGIVTHLWLSIASMPGSGGEMLGEARLIERRDRPFFLLKARLREGVSVSQSQAAMNVLAARYARDFKDPDGRSSDRGISVFASDQVRIHPQIDAILAPGATILMIVVGLVLAIACSNLTTLLLVRGTARRKEVSVRMAVGASRGQVLQHLLTESVLLAMVGTACGCVLAAWGVRILASLPLPVTIDLAVDARVLAFAVALSLVTGILFGLAPALRCTRVDLITELRDHGKSAASGRRWFNLKNGLLVFEVATSCLLLAATAFWMRSMAATQATETGFAVQGVAYLQIDPRFAGYTPQRAQTFYASALDKIRAIPGVRAAALASDPPGNIQHNDALRIPGMTQEGEGRSSAWLTAGPDYFETLNIPILYGRAFDARDRQDAPAAAIVNVTMARLLFESANAIGRRFALERAPDQPIEIVGVVPDTRTHGLNESPKPLFYRPTEQAPTASPVILARTSLDAGALAGSMQGALRGIDPAMPVLEATTLARHLEDLLRGVRALVNSLAGLGLLGLTLASIGLYATVSYAVSQRSAEVGLRMALGARRHQVVWIMARDVLALIGVGIMIGTSLAWVGFRVLPSSSSILPGVHIDAISAPQAEPLIMLAVATLIAAVGFLATFIPARRAALADPLSSLRHQ